MRRNIILTDQIPSLDIWKEKLRTEAIISIAVFNSLMSNAPIRVQVARTEENHEEFIVPSGNTITATVDGAELISVFNLGGGRVEGKFCLDVCICDAV